MYTEEGRWDKMREGAEFFKLFVDHPCPRVCIENPIPHKYAVSVIGMQYTQIVHPWQFGHPEQKATCLWLKGMLPKLEPTNNVKKEMMLLPKNVRERLHYLPPSEERAKLRSKTFQGFADAMADQWTHTLF